MITNKEIEEMTKQAQLNNNYDLLEQINKLRNNKDFNFFNSYSLMYLFSEIVFRYEKKASDIRDYTTANHLCSYHIQIQEIFLVNVINKPLKKEKQGLIRFVKLWLKNNESYLYNVSLINLFRSLIEIMDNEKIEYNNNYEIEISIHIP